jgi:hypothetical protein
MKIQSNKTKNNFSGSVQWEASVQKGNFPNTKYGNGTGSTKQEAINAAISDMNNCW